MNCVPILGNILSKISIFAPEFRFEDSTNSISTTFHDMNILDILLLSVALAMDCFALSILSGIFMGKRDWRVILQMSFFFGLFQALFPLIGWAGTSHFSHLFQQFDHWIAFGLLLFIGVQMIYEHYHPEVKRFDPSKLKTQLIMAVADSIDAFAVGISFACTGYDKLSSLTFPLWSIGIVSFLFSVLGCLLGIHSGSRIRKILKPELVGGIILIVIGLKILLTHLMGWE